MESQKTLNEVKQETLNEVTQETLDQNQLEPLSSPMPDNSLVTTTTIATTTSMSSSSSSGSLVGAGLANLGNTCFLNAVVQCFTHTVPLVETLRSYHHPNPCPRDSEGFCVFCALRDLIEMSLTSSGTTLCPEKLVDNLSYLSSSFRRYQQEDAHEFLQCLLDRLDTCCLDVNKDQNSSLQVESLVKKIFGGRLKSQLRCCNCGHSSDTYEPLIDLSLEIEDVDNLPNALGSFTKVEKIEETKFTCENCKEEVLMEKQFTLDQVPPVAAFHLKRFKNDGSHVDKLDKHVEYPLELDLQPYNSNPENNDVSLKYELYAIVVHEGQTSFSGHYFCFVRSSPQTWHQLDDSLVKRVSEEYVLSQEAYILFYAKQGTPWFSSLMETQKHCLENVRTSTSPKSVLDGCDNICTTYPICASYCYGNDFGTRHDEERIPIALPIDYCSIDVTKDKSDDVPKEEADDVMKDKPEVMKDKPEVVKDKGGGVIKEKSGNIRKDRSFDVYPRTPPHRSPSPDIYSDEPPEPLYVIPRDHLRLKIQTASNKKYNKLLDDSKRKEAFRLTRSMPSSRASKFKSCLLGSQSENSLSKKRRKMESSSDVVDSDKKGKSAGACRKLNQTILPSVKAIDFDYRF